VLDLLWTDIIIPTYSVSVVGPTNMSQQQQQQTKPKEIDWKRLTQTAGPYPIDAFNFVREGLSFTAHKVHSDIESVQEQDRHISGQQLCMGLRDFAIERYGLLAQAVLDHWHIRRTDDFGRIVFAMVDQGLLSKTQEDTPDDFRAVYDFDEAFSAAEVIARVGSN
jgi:uncharacterized repeat protein (TIGR04138 family)